MSESPKEIPVNVTTMYGAINQRGLVTLTVGETATTMLPHKAREIGLMLIAGAEAAQTDEMLMNLGDQLELEHDQKIYLLRSMREWRQKKPN
jgi:hypothetical protein